MSGKTPPGTQWLRSQGSKQSQQPMLQLAAAPQKGSWQHAVKPNDDGTYDVYVSPGHSDQWQPHGQHRGLSLSEALGKVQELRGVWGGE